MYFVLKYLSKLFLTPVCFLIFITCPPSFSRYLNLDVGIFQQIFKFGYRYISAHLGQSEFLPLGMLPFTTKVIHFIIHYFFLFPSFFHSFSFYFLLERLEEKFNGQVPCVSRKVLRQKTSSQSLATLGKQREVRTKKNTSGNYKNVGKGFH